MAVATTANGLVAEFGDGNATMGAIKKRAKEIGRDHDLANELWSSGNYGARLLSVLILDKKQLTATEVERLAADMLEHDDAERDQLADWLLANQLTKAKNLVSLLETWEQSPSPVLRRLFWYHQGRLRWVGQTPPPNTKELLDALEEKLPTEKDPAVQGAMNFCAGWIGVHDPTFRARCIKLGKQVGLYKDEVVAKNCTPSYLPEFIRIESAKLEGA